ncbi:MAG TPA: CopG family transcriptional regulator [Chloroflexota bacterium]|nr:CopG family transcriptional regulator [Chloroflexota bacterium]
MTRRATQIYLSEAEYAALQRAADRSGSSMAAIVRGLVEQYLISEESPPTDLTDLIGAVSTREPTDVATQKDQMLYEEILGDIRGHERPLRVAES